MPSFRLDLKPQRRAAARHVGTVRRSLQRAYLKRAKEDPAFNQSEMGRRLGVGRSVIHRQMRGRADLSLGTVAELAWAMGYKAKFELEDLAPVGDANRPAGGNNYTISVQQDAPYTGASTKAGVMVLTT